MLQLGANLRSQFDIVRYMEGWKIHCGYGRRSDCWGVCNVCNVYVCVRDGVVFLERKRAFQRSSSSAMLGADSRFLAVQVPVT